jgi:hypothetical protein
VALKKKKLLADIAGVCREIVGEGLIGSPLPLFKE